MRKDSRYCENDGSEHVFLIGIVVVLSFIILLPFLFVFGSGNRGSSVDDLKPRLIDTNSLGCSKYLYKGSVYWTCPEELNINSIEVSYSSGKTTRTELEPVVQQ